MDLNSLTLQQLFEMLAIPATGGASGIATIAVAIKFFGKNILRNTVQDVIDERYTKDIEPKVNETIQNKIIELDKRLDEDLKQLLEKHALEIKSENSRVNDEKYLSRAEFRLYMDQQNKVNERVEASLENLRQLCSQILMKISE